MKITVIEGNYGPQGREAAYSVLPDSTLLRSQRPFFIPDFDTEFLAFVSPAGAELTFPDITVKVDGETAAVWTASMANGDAAAAVELASVNNTLKTGDLILTALHSEGVKLRHPARLTAEIGGVTVLDIPLR